MRRAQFPALALLALVALAPACSCGGDEPGIVTLFSDAQFTPDGTALVLEATDGIYVASPPDSEPRKVSEHHCAHLQDQSLGCIRVSADSARLAILTRPHGPDKKNPLFDLYQFRLRDLRLSPIPFSNPEPTLVTETAYDAAFSQDGQELVWARPVAGIPGAFGLWRLGRDGEAVELVHSATLEGGVSTDAGRAFVAGLTGVAYPRLTAKGTEVWFKPFDDTPLYETGLVRSPDCAGTHFADCVIPTPDGSTLFWQDATSYVLHLFNLRQQSDLPLGHGYGLAFSKASNIVMRVSAYPDAVYLHNAQTAGVVRTVLGANSGTLSNDGETVAYSKEESAAKGSGRVFIGPTRGGLPDAEYDVFEPGKVRPLIGLNQGGSNLDYALSGDARFLVVGAKSSDETKGALTVLTAGTSERRELDALTCNQCCIAAPEGSMLLCLPTLDPSKPPSVLPIDLYDLGSGEKTRATEAAADLGFIFDGSGVAVIELKGRSPSLVIATKDGKVTNLGGAVRFALSPNSPTLAFISTTGGLTVRNLP